MPSMPREYAVWHFRAYVPPLPLAQARPRSQNSISTPTSLDKPVLGRDTHASKARYVTATPGIAMLGIAEDHIQTNRVGLWCVVRCCDGQNAPSQT